MLSYIISPFTGYKSTSSERQVMCRPRLRRPIVLSHLSTLDLTLWWAEQAQFQATCYVWCTSDGHLPSRPTGSHLTVDDLTDLVKNNNTLIFSYKW